MLTKSIQYMTREWATSYDHTLLSNSTQILKGISLNELKEWRNAN
ncbi:hypothetical protein [Nitrosopumilus sp. K4]|nr:hypothetical protein [Nitrosopumilus sp. K4]